MRCCGDRSRRPEGSGVNAGPTVEIALALVLSGNRVLVARRSHGPLAGQWEFPGGKIEPGETWEDASVRECREEVGLEVRPLERLGTVEHAYAEVTVRLNLVVCEPSGPDQPRPLVAGAVAWAGLDELGGWGIPEPNHEILDRLKARPRKAD